MRLARLFLVGVWLSLAAFAAAQFADVQLQAQPNATVADGRSTVSISATLRNQSGSNVPDGTQVVFTTTKGSIDQPIVKTLNGVARVTLRAGSIPGFATITATALQFNATATLEFEFVSDRAMLSSAKEYIELYSGGKPLLYSLDAKTAEGSDPEGGMHLRYKEVDIEAQDLQVVIPLHEVRARKAVLKIGHNQFRFDQLYYKLNTRKGFGTTTYMSDERTLVPYLRGFAFAKTGQRERFGMVSIDSDGIKPVNGRVEPRLFEFEEISDSASLISSRKMIAYPRKEVQFQKAEIYVGGARVMKVPLFQVNLYGPTPVLTDQIVNLRDNQVALNYPYYLSLKPGETSLLRFRSGDRYGRGSGASRGTSLDYELYWNRGDESDGSLLLQGILRKDWGIGARHFWKPDERTDINVVLDAPSHSSLFGSLSAGRRFDGFSLSANGSNTRSLRGAPFSSSQYSLVAEKDPTRVGKLPVKLYYGVTASHQLSNQFDQVTSQSAVGLRARLQSDSIALGKTSNLNTEFSVSRLYGHNTPTGLALAGSAFLSTRLSNQASFLLGYQFMDDGYSGSVMGKHYVTAQLPIYSGRNSLDLFAGKSLDIDRVSYRADARVGLFRNTRLGYSYTYERYFGQGFTDYNFFLGYTIGFKEFGLTWSNRTKRIGFEVLGAGY